MPAGLPQELLSDSGGAHRQGGAPHAARARRRRRASLHGSHDARGQFSCFFDPLALWSVEVPFSVVSKPTCFATKGDPFFGLSIFSISTRLIRFCTAPNQTIEAVCVINLNSYRRLSLNFPDFSKISLRSYQNPYFLRNCP